MTDIDTRWVDLVDPTEEDLRAHLPEHIHVTALNALLAPHVHDDEPRPRIESHGDYVLGIFLLPVAVPDEDRVYYQEIDIIATHEQLISISKTPPGEQPFDPKPAKDACRVHENIGMFVYHLVDEIAESYLDLVDALDDEIDELEDLVADNSTKVVGRRLRELRQDLRGIRRTLTPTRDAVHKILDNRIELDDGELFPATSRSPSATRTTSCCARARASSRRATRSSRRARLPPGEDRERPERGDEAPDGDRVAAARPDLHRRPLRPELPPHPGARLELRLLVVVGPDHRDDDRAARVLPLEALAVERRIGARATRPARMPFYICPQCKERSLDIDAREGFSTQAPACHHCGFGFLFELLDDYYPAPDTGFVVTDQGAAACSRSAAASSS